ncbi:helix-turn-helix domain-containing protein [Phaeacidiphilus oryzae]|uniref:helix-turn-helix domain-containing protein n=1 Tax=Phaeacidiphilus oryzae TaxID=348818 RepID=UPI000A96F1FC|nr:helix-turn-helix domain-containing protein [Phaeacidiphilus oryzae]
MAHEERCPKAFGGPAAGEESGPGTDSDAGSGGGPGSGSGSGSGYPESELTVGALLAEPMLRGRLLGGEKGLGRTVAWCLPLSEVAAVRPAGDGDLTGTAVYLPAVELAGHDRARALLQDLARRGSPVVFARPRAGGTVSLGPAALAADDIGLPLVGLPPEVDYGGVGRLVAVKALAATAHVLEYGVRVHRILGEVFATGSGLPALAAAMSTLAATAVLITDDGGEVLATAGSGGTPRLDPEVARELAAQVHARLGGPPPEDERQRPARHPAACDLLLTTAPWGDAAGGDAVQAVAAPVRVAGELYGAVVLVEPRLPADTHDLAQHRVIVEQAAPLVASELLRQRSVTEAEERARDDFLDSLVHGRFADVHALEARSRHYRFDAAARHVVFVVAAPGIDPGRSQQLLRTVVRGRAETADGFTMAGFVGRLLVVVRELPASDARSRYDVQVESAEIQRFGRQVQRAVRERVDGEIQITHGRGAPGAAGVAAGYREARIVLELSQRVDVPEVCGYERLRVFAAIEEAAASKPGREFAREVLEPLRKLDGQTGDLERVVLAYIAESGNLNAAARRLQLHRNTMLYKLERASRALGMDVRSAETQFTVWLAYRIHTLNDSLRALDAELAPPA